MPTYPSNITDPRCGASCPLEWQPPSELEEIERLTAPTTYARPRPRWRAVPDEVRVTRPDRVRNDDGYTYRWPRTRTGELLYRLYLVLGAGALLDEERDAVRLVVERLGVPEDAWL